MADQLVSVLGFDATQAISTLGQLDAALRGYTTGMQEAAAATRSYNKAAKGVDTQLRKQSNAIKGFANTSKNLANVQRTGAEQSRKVTASNKQLDRSVAKVGETSKKTSQVVLLSWQSVTRVFLLQGIHSALTNLTMAFQEGATAAREFEISLAEIQTIGRGLNLDLDELAEEVRGISEAFAIPLETVAEATYQTLSNQVAEASETFNFLEDASTLAVGAVTDLDSAVNLLSSVINSYGFNARDADELSGKLFKTIELGRIRGQEFANTYGRVLVIAAQLGISFDEVNASMATYTVSGLKANDAMTLITNVMLKLIRPTDALRDRMDELGVTTAEAGIQAFGYQGFLQEITKEAGASASAIGKLFGRIRATRGVAGISNELAEVYTKNKELIEAAGETDIEMAKKTILEVDSKQLERDMQAIKNFFTVDLGRVINTSLLHLSQFVGGGVTAMKAFGAAILTSTALFVGLKVAGTTTFIVLTSGTVTFTSALIATKVALLALLSPLALIIAAGAAVGVAFIAVNRLIDKTSTDSIKKIEKASKVALDLQIKQIQKRQKAEGKVNKAILSDTQKFLFERQKLFIKDQERAKSLESLVLTSFTDQIQDRLSAFEGFVEGLREKSKEAIEAIKEARDEISSIEQDISTFRFERELVGLDEGQVVARQMEQANKFRMEAQHALRARDFERAEELQDQAQELNKQALQSADQLKDRNAISKIERSIVDTYKEQQNLQKALIGTQRKQEKVAEQERAASEVSLSRLQQYVRDLDELEITAFDDPEKAKAAFKAVTQNIEQEFKAVGKKLGVADYLGLKQYINDAMEPLRDPTTGKEARLDLILDPNIDLIFDTLSKAWDNIPEEAKLQLSDITGESFSTAEGFAPLIEGVVATAKEMKKINEAELQRATIERGLLTNLQVREEIQKKILRGLGIQENVGKSLQTLGLSTATTDRQRLKIIEAFSVAQQGLAAGSVEIVNQQIKAFEAYKEGLVAETQGPVGIVKGRLGLTTAITEINKLIENYKAALELRNNLLVTTANTGEANQEIQELGATVVNAKVAVIEAEAQAQQANQRTIEIINNKTGAVKRYIEAVRGSNELTLPTPQGKGFAKGGSVGTDVVPAMLTPGEFVMNAKSTRKFYPQLVAMNSGSKPIFRQNGGSVTNVGDVSITVSGSAEPKQTARETMKAFRRVIRRDATSF